jgi:tripartite ATP-independent transporter DctM subunit
MDLTLQIVVLFVCMFLALAAGSSIAFALGGIGVLFTFFLWNPNGLAIVPVQAFDKISGFAFLACPLFIFMGIVLERSGIADDLYEMMHSWFGALKGGLSVGTVIICTLFAALTGISGAATVTMGLIALPSMLRRGYEKELSLGCISAGGALGILIPPSITMIIYGLIAPESVGKLFAGGVFAGLVLSALFIMYILIRARLQPHLAPALPPEERASWRKKIITLKAVIAPIFLMGAVLGSIFGGLTSVSEAAAIGALGSLMCAAVYRKLTWEVLVEALQRTTRLACMVLWIILGATAFSTFVSASGASHMIERFILGLEINRWWIMIAIQLIWVILGMIMETTGIIMVTVPIFVPIIKALGFDPVWFGVIFIVNMEMGFLTPPFGYNLFFMKAVVPPGITMGDIYRSIVPFVGLQAVGLALCMVFPEIITFLPKLVFGYS